MLTIRTSLFMTVIILSLVTIALTDRARTPISPNVRRPMYYFPTEIGSKWTYQCGDKEYTKYISSVEKKQRNIVVTVSLLGNNRKRAICEIISISEKGILLLSQDG